MPHQPSIRTRGFLFDMDGTLVDSTAVVEAIWTGFAREHGLDAQEILGFSHGRQTADTLARFLPRLDPAERARIERDLAGQEFARTEGIAEIPGAAALLSALREAGAPVAMVTSASRDLALARMRLASVPVPDVVIAAEDATRSKPAPDGYLRAAGLLGVPADACTVFEDAEAGLRAGLASRAAVVVVGGHVSATTEGLTRIPDYTGLTVSAGEGAFSLNA